MFLGRDRELSALESEYKAKGFRMTIVYGRRRVGKTELLNKFSEDKEVIFYTASEASAENNLTGFEGAIFEALSPGGIHPHFRSFEEAFLYIGEHAGKKSCWLLLMSIRILQKVTRAFHQYCKNVSILIGKIKTFT